MILKKPSMNVWRVFILFVMIRRVVQIIRVLTLFYIEKDSELSYSKVFLTFCLSF